jgi:hypothetical protein
VNIPIWRIVCLDVAHDDIGCVANNHQVRPPTAECITPEVKYRETSGHLTAVCWNLGNYRLLVCDDCSRIWWRCQAWWREAALLPRSPLRWICTLPPTCSLAIDRPRSLDRDVPTTIWVASLRTTVKVNARLRPESWRRQRREWDPGQNLNKAVVLATRGAQHCSTCTDS